MSSIGPDPRAPMSPFKQLSLAACMYVALGFLPSLLVRPLFVIRLALAPSPVNLPVPVQGVSPRVLRNSWGAARGDGRTHQGIDIFAPRGTTVFSTTDGIVTRVGQNNLGGNVVWVLGPGRQMHYYAHLERFASIGPGDMIFRGDALGYVGNSGNARTTVPHLHYGIYVGTGAAVDPYPLLAPPAPRAGSGTRLRRPPTS